MQDFLTKIGLPATIAAIISGLAVVIPFLFKVDERYAKDSELQAAVFRLEKANTELRHELAQAVGFQQAMIALIQAGKLPKVAAYQSDGVGGLVFVADDTGSRQSKARTPTVAASEPIVVVPRKERLEKPQTWQELSEALARQKHRLTKE